MRPTMPPARSPEPETTWNAEEVGFARAHPEWFAPQLYRSPSGRYRVWVYNRYLHGDHANPERALQEAERETRRLPLRREARNVGA